MPGVGRIEDMGEPTKDWNIYDPLTGTVIGTEKRRKFLDYSAAIGPQKICLVRASGKSLNAVRLDPDHKILIREGESLAGTPQDWPAARRKEFRDKLIAQGMEGFDIKDDDLLWDVLGRFGRLLMPGFTTRGTWTR
ncbi:MAG: hypothetical protein ACE5IR_27150 [bacterium]